MECRFCAKEMTGNKGVIQIHEQTCRSNTASPFIDSLVFVENSTFARHLLKKRIIENNLLPYCCAICNLGPEWQGKPMPLILDHINGKNNDNRLENLRFVCSNCDSQLPTYKSRNRRRYGIIRFGSGKFGE